MWLAGLYQDWLSGWHALVLGAAVAAAAPVGDLFESYLKRDAGTKDTGRLFGAHGGALDRLDAAMFAMVAGFYVWHAMSRRSRWTSYTMSDIMCGWPAAVERPPPAVLKLC